MNRNVTERRSPRRRRRAIIGGLVSLAFVAAACGDDDDSSTGTTAAASVTAAPGTGAPGTTTPGGGASGTTAASGGTTGTSAAGSECEANAKAAVAGYDKIPTKLPDQFTPLAAPPKPGGTIIKIANGSIPSDVESGKTQADAAKAIGWTAKTITFDGTVEDLNAKWEEAISQKPTAIAGAGFPAAALQKPLADAKAAGIVAVLSSVTDEANEFPGLAATINGSAVSKLIGTVHANLVMADSGCDAKVAIFSLPFPILKVATDEFQAVLASECPKCEVSYNEIQPQDIGSPSATNAIVSALQADPDIKYVYTIIGNVAVGLTAALDQANIEGIKIFGQVPDENSIKALQDGTNAWWLTQSSLINGYMELDGVLRALEAKAPFVGQQNPIGVLTPDNVPKGSTAVPAYPENYPELFKQLWGVG